jgi:hypothetical protein
VILIDYSLAAKFLPLLANRLASAWRERIAPVLLWSRPRSISNYISATGVAAEPRVPAKPQFSPVCFDKNAGNCKDLLSQPDRISPPCGQALRYRREIFPAGLVEDI